MYAMNYDVSIYDWNYAMIGKRSMLKYVLKFQMMYVFGHE
jgi:hypothetical protein